MKLRIRFPLFAVLALTACNNVEPRTVDATVIKGVEFDCWALKSIGGTTYLALNLPDGFRHDSLAVRVTFTERHDIASYCMQGQSIDVLAIQAR